MGNETSINTQQQETSSEFRVIDALPRLKKIKNWRHTSPGCFEIHLIGSGLTHGEYFTEVNDKRVQLISECELDIYGMRLKLSSGYVMISDINVEALQTLERLESLNVIIQT